MNAAVQMPTPIQRRAGFEVTAWDGVRWQLVGIYHSAEEAKFHAKALLPRRHAVRVSEETFSENDGTFSARIIFSERREGAYVAAQPTRRKPKPDAMLGGATASAESTSNTATLALYLAAASTAIALLSLFVALIR